MELFKDHKLLNKGFGVVANSEESLKDKIIGLYFSASWSIPCHEFTPTLATFHKEMENRQAQFQIVYVPFDKTEEEMKEYVRNKHGNWLLVPWNDRLVTVLREQYSVSMVPKLVIIKPDGEVVTERGRKEVGDRGVSAYRSWSTAAFGPQVYMSRTAAILQSIDASIAKGSGRSRNSSGTPARVDSGVTRDSEARVDSGVTRDSGARVDSGVTRDSGARVDTGVTRDSGARVDSGVTRDSAQNQAGESMNDTKEET